MDYEWIDDKLTIIASDKELARFRKIDKMNNWGWLPTDNARREIFSLFTKFRWVWSEPHVTGDMTSAPIIAAIDEPFYSKDHDPTDAESMQNSCLVYAGQRSELGNICHFFHPIRARWAFMDYQITTPQDVLLSTGRCTFTGDHVRQHVVVTKPGDRLKKVRCRLFKNVSGWWNLRTINCSNDAFSLVGALGNSNNIGTSGTPTLPIPGVTAHEPLQAAVDGLSAMARRANLTFDIEPDTFHSSPVTFRYIDRFSTLTTSLHFVDDRIWPDLSQWFNLSANKPLVETTLQKARMAFSGGDNSMTITTNRLRMRRPETLPRAVITFDKGRVHGYFIEDWGTIEEIASSYGIECTPEFKSGFPIAQVLGSHYGVFLSIDFETKSFSKAMELLTIDKQASLVRAVNSILSNMVLPFIERTKVLQTKKSQKESNQLAGSYFRRYLDLG